MLLRVAYGAPGALLGTLSELVAAPQVRGEVRASLASLAREATGQERPPPAGPALPRRLAHEAMNVGLLARAGLVAPMRPDKVARLAVAAARWGASPATAIVAGAIRHPDRILVDRRRGRADLRRGRPAHERHRRGLAAEAGVGPGDRVGVLCRDGRAFVEAVLGVAKLGADAVLLNPSFAAPQVTEVCRREEVAALVVDEDLAGLTRGAARGRPRVLAWRTPGSRRRGPSLEALAAGDPEPPAPPPAAGRVTILTSGTTGVPKGATRGQIPLTLDPAAALLERIPLREGQVVRVAAPLFHAWGFANLLLGMALGDTLVLRRRFDPEGCLADVAAHRCDALVVVPVMLGGSSRCRPRRARRTTPRRCGPSARAGRPCPASCRPAGWTPSATPLQRLRVDRGRGATIATPEDLRACARDRGPAAARDRRAPLDEDGRRVPQGDDRPHLRRQRPALRGLHGRRDKDRIDGLMSTGDLGHFDAAGRLFVDGRDDDMIVSGGENVSPRRSRTCSRRTPPSSTSPSSACPTRSSASGCGPSSCRPAARESSRRTAGRTSARSLARFKVPRDVDCRWTSCRARRGKVLKRELAERG